MKRRKTILILSVSAFFMMSCNHTNANDNDNSNLCKIELTDDNTQKQEMNVSFLDVKLGYKSNKAIEIIEAQGIYVERIRNIALKISCFDFGGHIFDDATFRIESDIVYSLSASSSRIFEGRDKAKSIFTDLKNKFLKKYGKYEKKDEELKRIDKKYAIDCSNILDCVVFDDGETEVIVDFIYYKTKNRKDAAIIDGWTRDNWYTEVRIIPSTQSHKAIDNIK